MLKLLMSLLILTNLNAKTVEIEVHGMTCTFCVDALQKKFKKLDDIKDVKVSLKLKKVRLETKSDNPDLDLFKKTVLDSGFTPTKIEIK